MKRLITGLVILGLIVALAVVGLIYTNSFVDKITLSLEKAEEKLNQQEFDRAYSICEETKETFESKERLFALFLNHGLIEEIEENLSLLPNFAKGETKELFLAYLEKTKTTLLELKESQKHIF